MKHAPARFREAHPVRRLDVGGVEWTYVTGGKGAETVLYLPGGAGVAEAAFTSIGALERDHRVIAVTYPRLPSMAALVDGLVAILDAEGVAAAHVWGSSFGGMAAQALLRRAPGRVASTVLSNTAAPDPARAERARRQLRLVAALPGPVVRWLLRLALRRQLRGLDARARSYLRDTMPAEAKPALLNLTRIGADFYRMPMEPWERGRVLLLLAEDDELYRSMHGPLRRLYPGAEVVMFEGGHVVGAARDEEYADAVRRFLARREPS